MPCQQRPAKTKNAASCQPPAAVEFSAAECAAHLVEDVLLGTALAALALEERVGWRMLLRAASVLLEAREQGRAAELLAKAKQIVTCLDEWTCPTCSEPNPGTFEICWQCQSERADLAAALSNEVDCVSCALLEIDDLQTRYLRSWPARAQPRREPESAPSSDPSTDAPRAANQSGAGPC